ncbi:MAG: pobA 2 [Chloroflexi bacterium]|nr:pobA 2 [Chloroflexota bacterium]
MRTTVRDSVPGEQVDAIDFTRTGPGTLAGRYLRCYWQPAFRALDIAPGRSKPARVMSEDLTVYRGESGEPHVVAFRCAHRGTQLSTGWVEGDDLRCFYHGWKYNSAGQCIEQPAEPEPFCDRIKIRSYPTREYLGLVFAYLGDGEPPVFPRYSAYEGDGIVEVGPCAAAPVNFFNRIDNGPDTAHLKFVHSPFLDRMGIPSVESVETEFGVKTSTRFPNGWLNETFLIMPNVTLFPGRPRAAGDDVSTDQLAWVVPVDDEHYRFVQVSVTKGSDGPSGRFENLTPTAPEIGATVTAGYARVKDFLQRPDIFEIQDCVSQAGQGTFAPRDQEHLGRSDAGVVLLRKIWERELQRLATGKPLTEWRVPDGLVANMGRQRTAEDLQSAVPG